MRPSPSIVSRPRRGPALALVTALCLMVSAALAVSPAMARRQHRSRAHHTTSALRFPVGQAIDYPQQCPEPYPAQRDPANPLDLSAPPGPDPLSGAHFFVDGPAHGAAAGAIAQLLGLNPKAMPNSQSWASFSAQLQFGPLAAKLAADPALAQEVVALSKIAVEPEAQRFSIYSMGGGPGAIFRQAEKIFCSNMQADPGSIPIISTYFLHPALHGCPSAQQIKAYAPTFQRRVDEVAAATDRRPAVYLAEIDALGSSSCIMHHGAMPAWESALRYEINTLQSLPHTVVYVEGGYSDSNSVGYTAKVLNAIGVRGIRGFFTNDTHENWTSNEVRWASKVSALTHGAHFVVNTAQNGRGPLLNPHPVTQGIEDLCNPPQRGLGVPDTTNTGFPYADAFLWTHPPGNSSGCGGGPSAGVFWPERAIELAGNANLQLGPGFASQPY